MARSFRKTEEETGVKQPLEGTVVREYFTIETPRLGLAVAEINGFYPPEGKWAVNSGVEEMYFVVAGEGVISYESIGVMRLKEKDGVHIPHGQKYSIEGRNLKLVIATAPSWYPEQHEWVDKK